MRECNQNENGLIRANMNNSLVELNQFSPASSGKIGGLIAGAIIGIIIGAIIAINVGATGKGSIKGVMIICTLIAVPICTVIGNFIGKINAKRKIKFGDENFCVVGGTCLGYITENSKLSILYMVDGARDEFGNLYCIKNVANDKVVAAIGERILVATMNGNTIIPMKITEETKNMVSLSRPVEHENVDIRCLRTVPHPNAFRIDRGQNVVTPQEVEMLANTQKFVTKRSGIKYKKAVIFAEKKIEWSGTTMVEKICVYEYENNRIEYKVYSWNINNCLPKSAKYGDIIYKYSKELDDAKANRYWFCKIM